MKREIKNEIIAVPLHLGANRAGIEFGPRVLEEAYPEIFGDMKYVPIHMQKENFNDWTLKYKNTILDCCNRLAKETNRAYNEGKRVITLGGDHSIALGSISGIAKEEKNLGIVWIDAHGDMNTNSSTESGNIHGMPLASLQGIGDKDLQNCFFNGQKINSRNVVILGARDVDKEEWVNIKNLGVKTITNEEVFRDGLEKTLENIKEYLKVDKLHISFDIDSIDPEHTPGVSTPVHKGLTPEEIFKTFSYLMKNYDVTSIDVVEFNPVNDKEGKTLEFTKNMIEYLLKSEK